MGNNKEIELPRLSQQLLLDSLWNTLSECLQVAFKKKKTKVVRFLIRVLLVSKELADTPDHHAVLVLQPAVEAFFLVHAAQTSKEEREKRSRRQETRESQLSHLQQEIGGPGSPSMAVQSSQDDSLNQLTLSMSSAPSSDLPPDTQKFLSFAERHRTVLNQVFTSTRMLIDDIYLSAFCFVLVIRFYANRRLIWPMVLLLSSSITLEFWTLTSSVVTSARSSNVPTQESAERISPSMSSASMSLKTLSANCTDVPQKNGRTVSTLSLKVKKVRTQEAYYESGKFLYLFQTSLFSVGLVFNSFRNCS